MAEWCFVNTLTKVPAARGTHPTPFETFSIDPNINTPFGPTKEYMFLPVVQDVEPVYNPITESLFEFSSAGEDGRIWPGKVVGDEWHLGWGIATNTLSETQENKVRAMQKDKREAIANGYAVGSYVFPYSEDFFRFLSDRYFWLDTALADAVVPSGTKVTFSDQNGRRVEAGITAVRNHFGNYGKAWIGFEEKAVDALEEIYSATTPEQVDAVTWNF